MTDWRAVGRRVKSLRESNKLTQDVLADALGYSRGTLGELERGTDRAGISLVVALADYFKVPVDWLLGRDIPVGGPLVGQFVDDPDELAWLTFWRRLTREKRIAVFDLLRVERERNTTSQ